MEFGFDRTARDETAVLEVKSSPGITEACSRFMGIDEELTAVCVRLCLMLGLTELAARVGVEWNPRMRSTAGRATWPVCLIELNTRLPKISAEEVRRTLLHELAHLVTYERLGHGNVAPHGIEWQEACSDLGIPGETATHRLNLPSRSLKRQWKYLCRSCGTSIERVRRFKGRVACYSCCRETNSGDYDERFRLVEVNLELSQ
ncbi:MAG: SprT-like domain-containing protein [Verrucomicrobiaceae bacterium]